MAKADDRDSGMESTNTSSKAQSPEKAKSLDDIDDEEDETVSERLWGLTEMFPDGVRKTTGTLSCAAGKAFKSLYGFSRMALWLFFSSSVLLFAPVIIEVERAQMEEVQRSQQKQVLLGPGSAISGTGNAGMMLPAVPR